MTSYPEKIYPRAVVIPVYAELELLPATLESLAGNSTHFLDETLIILVVNNPPVKIVGQKKTADNRQLLQMLQDNAFPFQSELQLYWVDASS